MSQEQDPALERVMQEHGDKLIPLDPDKPPLQFKDLPTIPSEPGRPVTPTQHFHFYEDSPQGPVCRACEANRPVPVSIEALTDAEKADMAARGIDVARLESGLSMAVENRNPDVENCGCREHWTMDVFNDERDDCPKCFHPHKAVPCQHPAPKVHNEFCRDDWNMYSGAGPRGMGKNNDGCVCDQAPPGYGQPPQKIRLAAERLAALGPGVTGLLGSAVKAAAAQEARDIAAALQAPVAVGPGVFDREMQAPVTNPRMWDEVPYAVTHIAGSVVDLFGRYIRQRCDWCGIVLQEWDLERVQVPVGTEHVPPPTWTPGSLVRKDGNVTAEVEGRQSKDGSIQLPPDACAFDRAHQIGG